MKKLHTKYQEVDTLVLFEGMKLKVLLTGEQTNGTQAVFEDIVEPNVGPPRHIHLKQDETFLFIEGTFDVEINGIVQRMTAGDTAFIPKGSVHAWKNVGDTVGRLRYIFSPALNIEQMFRELHSANSKSEIGPEVMGQIMKKYPEQESAGPPL